LAPNALIAVDVTQALGRITLDCDDADIIISSTHKWTLGIHGGCIIGVPSRNAEKLTTFAGGWYHFTNAFDADRFQRTVPKLGAASFSVGMPNFVALYALNASLRYLESVGIDAIERHANPLVQKMHDGLVSLGLKPMCPWRADYASGIVAFQHDNCPHIHAQLERENVHVMHHAGRIRIAIHGYNTESDVNLALSVLAKAV
jgi:selenocysteine lyase/cysteine desulfurase